MGRLADNRAKLAKYKQQHSENYKRLRKKHTYLWRQRYPEKYAAQQSVWWALKTGKLIRPSHCQLCWKECKPQAHHQDYTERLDVVWLCSLCHHVIEGGMRDVNLFLVSLRNNT